MIDFILPLGAYLGVINLLTVLLFRHDKRQAEKRGWRVPENTLKFGVGVMLSAFGVFWTGEGLGVDWPGGDLALFVLAALFLGAGLLAAQVAGHARREALP